MTRGNPLKNPSLLQTHFPHSLFLSRPSATSLTSPSPATSLCDVTDLAIGQLDGDEVSLGAGDLYDDEALRIIGHPARGLGVERLGLVDTLLLQRHIPAGARGQVRSGQARGHTASGQSG